MVETISVPVNHLVLKASSEDKVVRLIGGGETLEDANEVAKHYIDGKGTVFVVPVEGIA